MQIITSIPSQAYCYLKGGGDSHKKCELTPNHLSCNLYLSSMSDKNIASFVNDTSLPSEGFKLKGLSDAFHKIWKSDFFSKNKSSFEDHYDQSSYSHISHRLIRKVIALPSSIYHLIQAIFHLILIKKVTWQGMGLSRENCEEIKRNDHHFYKSLFHLHIALGHLMTLKDSKIGLKRIQQAELENWKLSRIRSCNKQEIEQILLNEISKALPARKERLKSTHSKDRKIRINHTISYCFYNNIIRPILEGEENWFLDTLEDPIKKALENKHKNIDEVPTLTFFIDIMKLYLNYVIENNLTFSKKYFLIDQIRLFSIYFDNRIDEGPASSHVKHTILSKFEYSTLFLIQYVCMLENESHSMEIWNILLHTLTIFKNKHDHTFELFAEKVVDLFEMMDVEEQKRFVKLIKNQPLPLDDKFPGRGSNIRHYYKELKEKNSAIETDPLIISEISLNLLMTPKAVITIDNQGQRLLLTLFCIKKHNHNSLLAKVPYLIEAIFAGALLGELCPPLATIGNISYLSHGLRSLKNNKPQTNKPANENQNVDGRSNLSLQNL